MENCDLRKNGKCKKFDGREACKESSLKWFTDALKVCEIDEVCRRSSIFGNSFFTITKEQLEALKEGKVLYDIDEYGTFIALEEDAK